METNSVSVAQQLRPSKERQGFLPTLSLAERDRRWRAVRDMMGDQCIDCLVVVGNDLHFDGGMANFRYLTHIGSKSGGYCVFPLEGAPTVFTGLPHTNRPFSIYLSTQDWVSDIRVSGGMAGVVHELTARGYERSRLGLVGTTVENSNIVYTDYARLRQDLPMARILDVTGAVNQLRVIKSEEETEMLQRAGRLARMMIAAMCESLLPGRRECDVWADMLHATITNGGEPVPFNLLCSGPTDEEPSLGAQHLLHGCPQPAVPSMRPLRRGDLVVTELHASWGGYLAAAEYSVFLGEAPEPLRRIHAVAVECFHSGVEKMRPGATVGEVVDAFRSPCTKAGMDYVELGFHGHGLSSQEIPSVVYKPDHSLLSGRGIWDMELKENMVFGTNIDIFDPRWRPDVGIMLGDTVQVARDGPHLLCNIPMQFPQRLA